MVLKACQRLLVALCTLMLHGEVQHRDPQAQHSQREARKVFAQCCAMSETSLGVILAVLPHVAL